MHSMVLNADNNTTKELQLKKKIRVGDKQLCSEKSLDLQKRKKS